MIANDLMFIRTEPARKWEFPARLFPTFTAELGEFSTCWEEGDALFLTFEDDAVLLHFATTFEMTYRGLYAVIHTQKLPTGVHAVVTRFSSEHGGEHTRFADPEKVVEAVLAVLWQ